VVPKITLTVSYRFVIVLLVLQFLQQDVAGLDILGVSLAVFFLLMEYSYYKGMFLIFATKLPIYHIVVFGFVFAIN
jgi:hypothetical protein